MEQIQGHLRKMIATAESPVSYRLPIGDVELPLNACLGKTMCIAYTGAITCIACGQRTKKSFHQGYCFRCFRTLDVHFISSLPVLQRPACMAWADTRCVQIVGAES